MMFTSYVFVALTLAAVAVRGQACSDANVGASCVANNADGNWCCRSCVVVVACAARGCSVAAFPLFRAFFISTRCARFLPLRPTTPRAHRVCTLTSRADALVRRLFCCFSTFFCLLKKSLKLARSMRTGHTVCARHVLCSSHSSLL